ncbi:MAG: TolC family protein [Candidatus Obscuribacterales bacterium]|nr:TolC family protein [Candidatus Obscuribacterales bacterium]
MISGKKAKLKSVFLSSLIYSGLFSFQNSEAAALDAPTAAAQKRPFKLLQIPAEPLFDHDANNKIDMGPMRQYSLLKLSAGDPVKLEASYNEALSLDDALAIALENSLPIRISAESYRYQKYQFLARAAGFLPSFSSTWSLSTASVSPVTTSANSRLFQSTLRYPVFLGGGTFYSALAQYYRMKGWRQAYQGTINDTLLDVFTKYSNLQFNYALLQILSKSYRFSQEQLELNNSLYRAGSGTQFAIMQSRAQLAFDEAALLQQQAVSRQSAMALAFALNLPMAINFLPASESIEEANLLSENLDLNHILNQSLIHRPELRQYEMFRLSAARNIQVASASLYPALSFFTSYTHASTTVYPAGNAAQLNGIASGQIAGAQGVGTATNTALNQTASFSPGGNNVGTSGANTTATVVAASGGNPIASTQSGSLVTSGAVAPNFNVNTITGGNGASNISGANTASAGVFPGLTNTFQAGLSLTWSLPNLGQGSVGNILSARSLARQALLQANQELLMVGEQVRFAYCSKLAARAQIDSSSYAVKSAGEALRLATLRLRSGVGNNLELIKAQRDYVAALKAHAQAIVASNIAQAQVLHDSGLISRETLLNGYERSLKDGRIIYKPQPEPSASGFDFDAALNKAALSEAQGRGNLNSADFDLSVKSVFYPEKDIAVLKLSIKNKSDRPVQIKAEHISAVKNGFLWKLASESRLREMIKADDNPCGEKLRSFENTLSATLSVGALQALRAHALYKGALSERYGFDNGRREQRFSRLASRILWPGEASEGLVYLQGDGSISGATLNLPIHAFYNRLDESPLSAEIK